MEEYEQENGLSFKEILKLSVGVDKKARIRFGIVAASVLVLGVLLILFVYNTIKSTYTSEWYYDVYTFSDNDYTYIDGDTFTVNDLYSLENVEKIIASNEELSSINAKELYSSEGFIVTKVEDTETKKISFKLNVNTRFFKSKDQAKLFIQAVANTPVLVTKEKIQDLDNSAYLRAYKLYSTSYEGMINTLTNQANYILDTYSELIKKYGDRKYDGNYLSDYRNDAESIIDSFKLSTLYSQVQHNGYVYKYDENLPVLEARKTDLEKKLAVVEKKINELEAQSLTTNDILAECIVQKADLEEELADVNNFISKGATADSTEFNKKLEDIYTALQSLTKRLTTSQQDIYSQKQTVYFDVKGVVEKNGYINAGLAIIASVLAGVVIAAVANLVIDVPRYKKELELKRKEEKAA